VLALRPTSKLEDHNLSPAAVSLFNKFAITLHIGGRSSIRNLRTRHAVVTGTALVIDSIEFSMKTLLKIKCVV